MTAGETGTSREIVESFKRSVPGDLDGLAKALDVEAGVDRAMPLEIACKIERARDRRFRVTINATFDASRRRYTLAHAIAHILLHADKITDTLVESREFQSGLGSGGESAAHRYALELLMPPALVRQKWDEGVRSVAEIAMMFDVSFEAAKIQLALLGLKTGSRSSPAGSGR